MNERDGPFDDGRLGLHKADARASGGVNRVPCAEGLLEITGPFGGWKYTLDGVEVDEERVLTLNQTDYSY